MIKCPDQHLAERGLGQVTDKTKKKNKPLAEHKPPSLRLRG